MAMNPTPLTMMNRRDLLSRTLAVAAAAGGAGLASPWLQATEAGGSGGNTLQPYRSEAEMAGALARWRQEALKLVPERRRMGTSEMASASPVVAAPMAPPAAMAKSAAPSAAADGAAESITNVQTAGVDEGGIVKRCGDYLVILRRGRLFTVRVGGDQLQPVSTVDAFAPGSDPAGAWYDELLTSDSTVVVIGYSYARGGTEIGLFDLDRDGTLRYRATHHLRSFDYYSSRNYASRLVGRKLIFYTPSVLLPGNPWSDAVMPGVRRWQGPATPPDFQRILPATRVYRTDDDFDPSQPLALHTLTTCDLSGPEMRCESSAVLGALGRVFYVSAGSVYVWTSLLPTRGRRGRAAADPGRTFSAVFRLPLDGRAPSALKTAGVPIDQMSFLEDQDHLNVLLRDEGGGEGMWGDERPANGRLALLRVPLAAFGDGRDAAQADHYRLLPSSANYGLQNRYVGEWLLYGGGNNAWALRPASAEPPTPLSPSHAVERIESLGPAMAVLVGNRGSDLCFSSVRLERGGATPAGRYVQGGARQGETRTHGFFYRPRDEAEGLLGLPILGARGPYGAADGTGTASVLYLHQRDGDFTPLGELKAQPGRQDDACRASCVDWYGNARPIFLGERILALLGYELIEGRLERDWRSRTGRLVEQRRISFAPGAVRGQRYSPFD